MRFHVAIILACSVTPLLPADWPNYFGPEGNLSSPETIRTNWVQEPPKVLWRQPIGQGFSSMAVSGPQVFTLVKRTIDGAEREVCLALDADTGEELWAANLDAARYTNLSGYDDGMDGPRSTPTIDGDRLFVSTSQLKLYCLDRTSGTVVWSRDFRTEFGSFLPAWENTASPLVVGDLVFLNSNAPANSLTAVRKSDGTTAWSGETDGLTHASPVFASIDGVPQVVFLTRSGLVAVVPESGAVLWRLPFSPSATSTAASPAVVGNTVYASAAYGSGTWLARVTRGAQGFTASEAAQERGTAYQAHWSTPVAQDGFLYCVPAPNSGQGRLTCLDVEAGTNRWGQTAVGSGNMGYGSVIRAANALIALTEAGELVLVEANPAAYTEIARFKVLERYCWNHAALANGRIYARSTSSNPEIVAVETGAGAPPVTELTLGIENAQEKVVRLTVRAGASGLQSGDAARLELRSTTALGVPLAQWPVLAAAFAITNSAAVVDIPVAEEAALYLRVQWKGNN
jgi:outer membrane protein assembly factor BamB